MPVRPPIHRPHGVTSYDHDRPSAAKRGYDGAWRDFRATYLRHNPFCYDCARKGLNTPATEPHHIKKVRERPDLRLDPTNLLPLCQRCHTARTNRGE